jgi:hypothetical protein
VTPLASSDNATQLRQRWQPLNVHSSPASVAQREQAEKIHRSAAQLSAGSRVLQEKSDTPQRVEEEELMQGKFDPVQRLEEEELMQGKFDPVQRLEEEELMQGKFDPVQRLEEEELMQGKFDPVQRVEEEELMQGKAVPAQLQTNSASAAANKTGLPGNLKSGIESLSGMSMDNVRVHYNSAKPAQLNALAYAQGTDIHVASGQEKHLPHEAWHVVQQGQGRVKPTTQLAGGAKVNDDPRLETEADVMGAKAAQLASRENSSRHTR